MNLIGKLLIGSDEYIVTAKFQAKVEEYMLFAMTSLEDRIRVARGEATQLPVLDSPSGLLSVDAYKYFVGGIRKSRTTGKVSKAAETNNLQIMLDTLHFAKMYSFRDGDISVNESLTIDGKVQESFSADDENLSFIYEKVNSDYSMLSVSRGAISFSLKESYYIPKVRVKFEEATDTEQEAIRHATIDKIAYEDLTKVLDMSWYKKDGVVLKDYRTVSSVAEFEEMYACLCEDALKAEQAGEELVVALDTETTGTNIFELTKSNPARDHGVAISISWKDNQAYVIFTDMAYFTSVNNEYCFSRLSEIFTEDRGWVNLHWGNKSHSFKRDTFHLVGQNFPFDRRVAISEGHALWFDDDTLNMAFNINPKIVRGNNGLKNLTRRIFGHETPELTDVLGKGNEAMYRYLADREVAAIYAGADADYTRMLYPVLRKLLGERMYKRYHNEDVKMLNILALSEYRGLVTDSEGVQVLGEQSFQNLRILREAAYSYVGAYMDYAQKMSVCKSRLDSGLINQEEYEQEVLNVHPDKDATYEFEFKGDDIRTVMFDILKYPVNNRTDTGLAKVDKFARKKLLQVDRTDHCKARKLEHSILVYGASYAEYEQLMHGSEKDKKKAKAMELINADEFNKKEYPLALLFEKYAVLNKEYTSYFEPIRKQNLEGRLFKTYSLSRIETRRIMNPSQTMKKNLKELIIPYSDQYYMLDFDLSQIELRLMYSLSPCPELIEKMKNPEADGHTENAAMVHHKPAYKVTKNERRGAKSVSFGVPYGLGDKSLCETMFGDTSEDHMFETRMTLYKWKKANAPIVALLEAARDGALEEVPISLEKRNFMDAWQKDPKTKEYLRDENGDKIPIPLGAVYNKLGFCRYFDLTEVDQSPEAKKRRKSGKFTAEESKIRRAAGNYPIQSYAAEFFRLILYRFYDKCAEYGIKDKVIWHMLIHDELLCSVHKSVNPILMYKIVKEACMITMPGHTNYFVGINIGDNWEQTKDDDREAPVFFVQRMIKRYEAGEFDDQTWFDHPWDFIRPYREAYVRDRIHEVLRQVQPGIDENPIDLRWIFDHFENYTVRAYVNDYKKNTPIDPTLPDGNAKDDAIYVSKFETWALDVFGEGKEIIGLDGVKYKLKKYVGEEIVEDEEDFLDDEEDEDIFTEDQEMYDFDEDAIIANYFDDTPEENDLDDFDIHYEYADQCTNVSQMTFVAPKYKNLKVLNNRIIVNTDDAVQENYLKQMITAGDGNTLMFKRGDGVPKVWGKVSDVIDLQQLDEQIGDLKRFPDKGLQKIGDRLIFTVKSNSDYKKVVQQVNSNKGFGYKVLVKDSFGTVKPVGQVKPNTDFRMFV